MTSLFLTDDDKWAAVVIRNPKADGEFVTAVGTTGIYCRPTCSARPSRRNVRFLSDGDSARKAGFRPCRRCKPD